MAARVVALALWRFAERAVLAASIVWAAIGLPRFQLAKHDLDTSRWCNDSQCNTRAPDGTFEAT